MYVASIVDKVDNLSLFPEMGRMVPELNLKNVREIIYGNYRIIYKIHSTDKVEIIAVHHSARMLKI